MGLRLLLYGGAVFVGVPLAFSSVLTRTYRSAAPGRPPHDFEDLWVAAGVDHVGAIHHPEDLKQVVGFLEENGL